MLSFYWTQTKTLQCYWLTDAAPLNCPSHLPLGGNVLWTQRWKRHEWIKPLTLWNSSRCGFKTSVLKRDGWSSYHTGCFQDSLELHSEILDTEEGFLATQQISSPVPGTWGSSVSLCYLPLGPLTHDCVSGHSGHGGPVPGLPSMEQPLPMSPGLAPDQFPSDIKPPLGLDMAGGFSMAKAVSESPGSFMSGMEMSRISQEMMGSGPHQEYGGQIEEKWDLDFILL